MKCIKCQKFIPKEYSFSNLFDNSDIICKRCRALYTYNTEIHNFYFNKYNVIYVSLFNEYENDIFIENAFLHEYGKFIYRLITMIDISNAIIIIMDSNDLKEINSFFSMNNGFEMDYLIISCFCIDFTEV